MRRFEGGPRRRLVSPDGGREPRWSPDGRALLYRHGAQVLSAPVLFTHAYSAMPGNRMWDVDWSTGSFIMVEGREAVGEFITVVNWLADVERLTRGQGR